MSTTIELTFAKIGIAIAILLGCCGATWFAADAHYSSQYAALKAKDMQKAADAQKIIDDKARADETVTKEVNDEAVAQIGVMSDAIVGLLQHPITITRTVTAIQGPAELDVKPDGPGIAASPGPADGPEKTIGACLDPATLKQILDIATSGIDAELEWRKWARGTGQAGP
jgi:hypothetical protein